MEKTKIIVRGLGEYIEKVSLLEGTQFYSRTTNFRPIYRGQSNTKWEIEPSVYRNGCFKNEGEYLKELIRIVPDEFDGLSRIDQIIKMQHYGLPTRLLDFTTNSLVALFFACSGNEECDGEVLEIHAFPIYHQDFVWISIIAKYIFEYPTDLPFDVELMISELKRDVKMYSPRGTEDIYDPNTILKILTSPIGLYPKYTNKRLSAQDGLFVIPGMEIKEKKPEGVVFSAKSYPTVYDLWPESREIIIPAECKTKIVDELEKIGMTKSALFPELETYAKDVVRLVDASTM